MKFMDKVAPFIKSLIAEENEQTTIEEYNKKVVENIIDPNAYSDELRSLSIELKSEEKATEGEKAETGKVLIYWEDILEKVADLKYETFEKAASIFDKLRKELSDLSAATAVAAEAEDAEEAMENVKKDVSSFIRSLSLLKPVAKKASKKEANVKEVEGVGTIDLDNKNVSFSDEYVIGLIKDLASESLERAADVEYITMGKKHCGKDNYSISYWHPENIVEISKNDSDFKVTGIVESYEDFDTICTHLCPRPEVYGFSWDPKNQEYVVSDTAEGLEIVSEPEVEGQGGKVVGPFEIPPSAFDQLRDTLDLFADISPELDTALSGKGNIIGVVTDGTRFIGVDPQGYDYPRYKTEEYSSMEEAVNAGGEGEWKRKDVAESTSVTEEDQASMIDEKLSEVIADATQYNVGEEFFVPDTKLVRHEDKEGEAIIDGYKVKFVSQDEYPSGTPGWWVKVVQKEKTEKESAEPEAPVEEAPPAKFKELKIKPKKLEMPPVAPGPDEELKAAYSKIRDSQRKLSQLKDLVNKAKINFDTEKKKLEEEGGKLGLEQEVKDSVDAIAELISRAETKVVDMSDFYVTLVDEVKDKDFKPGDKWKLQKVLDKFPEAITYLQNAINGAQSMAQPERIREVITWPKKSEDGEDIDKAANPDIMDLFQEITESLENFIEHTDEISADMGKLI